MSSSAPASGHRCPRCGAAHAERRTARNLLERSAVMLLGYHPYRCLECGRRFHDRPLQDTRRGRPADDVVAPELTPVAAEHGLTLTLSAQGSGAPAPRHRTRYVPDPGNSPLARREIYTLVIAGTLIALAVLTALRFVWPEATGGVRLDH